MFYLPLGVCPLIGGDLLPVLVGLVLQKQLGVLSPQSLQLPLQLTQPDQGALQGQTSGLHGAPQPVVLLLQTRHALLQLQVLLHQLLLGHILQALDVVHLVGLGKVSLEELPASVPGPADAVAAPAAAVIVVLILVGVRVKKVLLANCVLYAATYPAGSPDPGLGVEVRLLSVVLVHQELGGVVGGHREPFGEHLFSQPGGPGGLLLLQSSPFLPRKFEIRLPVALLLRGPAPVFPPAQARIQAGVRVDERALLSHLIQTPIQLSVFAVFPVRLVITVSIGFCMRPRCNRAF